MDDPSSVPSPVTINLSELDLAPAWVTRAQGEPSGQVTWEHRAELHPGGPGGERRRSLGGPPRGERRERQPRGERSDFDKRDSPQRAQRPGGDGQFRRPPFPQSPRGATGPAPPRPHGESQAPSQSQQRPAQQADRQFRRGKGSPTQKFEPRGQRDREFGREREFHRPAPQLPAPPPGWSASILPEQPGVESLSMQIKATGRAYGIFDLARLFLARPERYRVRFEPRQGARPPLLTLCATDGSLWLSREEARQHFASARLLTTFFKEERIEIDPPKGSFTAIAICGLSGTVLGPPNFHAYQRNLVHLHQERFKNMPLDKFKSRIRIERDDEAVKKWLGEQSTQIRYVLPEAEENAPVFQSADEAVRYLFETREAEILADAPVATVPGNLPTTLLSPGLSTLLRIVVEDQRRFPMQLVQELCRKFEQAGLRFFKENKRETFVSRSRPRPLDPRTPVSDRVKAIIQFIRQNAQCTYREVVLAIAPQAAGLVTEPPTPPSAPSETPVPESISSPATPVSEEASEVSAVAEGSPQPREGLVAPIPAVSATTPPAPQTPSEKPPAASPPPNDADREGIAVLQDLRWLIREGYVTEFSNGHLRVVERTERHVIVQPPRRLRLLGRAFTLWTQPYAAPPPRRLRLPGNAFTLWTRASFSPALKQPLSLPGNSFTLWTAAVEEALLR